MKCWGWFYFEYGSNEQALSRRYVISSLHDYFPDRWAIFIHFLLLTFIRFYCFSKLEVRSNILRRLGPGLLFAAAAIGVSHLVYATRAGALYSLGLLWLIVLVGGALLLLSFLTAPFFALANYRLVTFYLAKEDQPSRGILLLSKLGIGYLFVFCGLYVWSLV